MFRDREDAGLRLAQRLRGREFRDPLVLVIPCGGVVVGAALARDSPADLDVVLCRKLRTPGQPEVAIGAISEAGEVYLEHHAEELTGPMEDYLAEECQLQFVLIERRRKRFRWVRPSAPVAGRSVIVIDDGIATGSTMIAALKVVRAQKPYELIVAVPVASPGGLREVARWCDKVVCLYHPRLLCSLGQFFEDFTPVEDGQVVALLREFAPAAAATDFVSWAEKGGRAARGGRTL
jgi:predicted phosphoribosyltransferase